MALPALAIDFQTRHWLVRGRVQGVGFRPFVYRLANELALGGWVRNTPEGVEIAAGGDGLSLDLFALRLRSDAPSSARIETIETLAGSTGSIKGGFTILSSALGKAQTEIGPDLATCPDCLDELFDPHNRRYRHAFINCTYCGPRFTLTRGLPYDRPHTSMAGFSLCPRCAAEYQDPGDRRFHAQANCCPDCGPQLALYDASGKKLGPVDAIAEARERLRRGEILALKGLGGYHLACDAHHAQAVAKLRQRKHREEKPFALMMANVASIEPYAEVDAAAADLLQSPQRPIVLLKKRAASEHCFPGAAPDIAWLGVMLPYTPLHWLLFFEAAGRPQESAWREAPQPLVLVMTSANPQDEPLVIDDQEAFGRLADIADAYLIHDRAIAVRADDSVVRVANETAAPAFLRRARGYTPAPIVLDQSGPVVLALGAHLKNTICVTRDAAAFVSQHIGDLDHPATRQAQHAAAEHLLELLQVSPQAIACDLHPDYFSTRLAQRWAQELGLPLIPVQHHQAHIAAIAAEHGHRGPLLGLALDGTGYGRDGGIWGGELLHVDGANMERLGHLAPLPLPGGDRAAREPWRMAAAVLFKLGRGEEIAARFPHQPGSDLARLLASGRFCPETSSAGRLFDAAAGLLGLQEVASFEGQAAMRLEGLAEGFGPVDALPDGFHLRGEVLDFSPLLGWLAETCAAPAGAACFHATLVAGLAAWVAKAARERAASTVALGGGCFLNQILLRELRRNLEAQGLRVLCARAAPPNDGGIALGQAWVARQLLQEELTCA